MRVFALSDIHTDYDANARWIENVSTVDYTQDLLILAGDVSDSLQELERSLGLLSRRFRQVLYVPGNHELWVLRDRRAHTSLEKFELVRSVAASCRVSTQPLHYGGLSIVPLFAWYDYSLGIPDKRLLEIWMDFRACSWPPELTMQEVTAYFLGQNAAALTVRNEIVISFSHFLPRIDLLPPMMVANHGLLNPIMGTSRLDAQIRQIDSTLHVYGHSHLNRSAVIDGVRYVNNALGAPHESHIASRTLKCVYDGDLRA